MLQLSCFVFHMAAVAALMLAVFLGGGGVFGLLANPDRGIPALAALKNASGTVIEWKVVRRRRAPPQYLIKLQDDAGRSTRLWFAEFRIGKDALRALLGQPVTARFTYWGHIWELSSGGSALVTHEATKTRRLQQQHSWKVGAPYMLGAAVLLGPFAYAMFTLEGPYCF